MSHVEERDDAELCEYLHENSTAGQRAKSLVQQILDFARKKGDELIPVRVDLLVKEVTKFLGSTITKMIEVKTRINSRSMIMANPVKMPQDRLPDYRLGTWP